MTGFPRVCGRLRGLDDLVRIVGGGRWPTIPRGEECGAVGEARMACRARLCRRLSCSLPSSMAPGREAAQGGTAVSVVDTGMRGPRRCCPGWIDPCLLPLPLPETTIGRRFAGGSSALPQASFERCTPQRGEFMKTRQASP